MFDEWQKQRGEVAIEIVNMEYCNHMKTGRSILIFLGETVND